MCGEIAAGIILGPSVLGRLAPDVFAAVFPTAASPVFGVLSQIGLILLMFLVGLELNTDPLRQRAHATVVMSHASIIAPFVMGSALALFLLSFLS